VLFDSKFTAITASFLLYFQRYTVTNSMFIMLETVGKSLLIFILAGLCEIGGGYLVWLWMKADKPL